MRVKKKPQPGDYILVYWVDITGDTTGQTIDAKLTNRVTGGFFHHIGSKEKTRCLFCSLTWNVNASHGQASHEGYDVYPMSVIKKIEVIREAGDIQWPTLKSA